MLKIIRLNQSREWNEIIQSMNEYDFYHLAEYHKLDQSGEALLLYYRSSNASFAFPVILREIEGTPYKDITSVYGYAGPLSRNLIFSEEDILLFQNELKKFFDQNNIIVAFSRLHPFFKNQHLLFRNLGEVVDANITVSIDLTLPEIEQRSQYSHSVRNDINRLEKGKIQMKKAETRKEIDAFIDIYRENMKRVNASDRYFFSDQYFYDFLESIKSTLLLAYIDNVLVSGSLFTTCNGILQSHLSATKDKYLDQSPLKYVWDRIRILGTKEKMKAFHLGGGYGGQNDTLYEFKSQFSKQQFMFKIWKYIHNQDIYNSLVCGENKENLSSSSYFPLYRE